MPVTNFPITTAGIVASGVMGDTYYTGRACRCLNTINCTIDLAVTGTDCSVNVAISTVTGPPMLQVSIDGGAFANVASYPNTTGTWTTCVLFTGLADTSHTVRLRQTTGSNYANLIDSTNTFVVTGSAPAVAYAPHFGPDYKVSSPFWASNCLIEGYSTPTVAPTSWHIGTMLANADTDVDCVYRFTGNPTEIRVSCLLNGFKLQLVRDGVAYGAPVTATNTSIYDWFTVATGLDGLTHDYSIVVCYHGVNFYLYSVMAVGGTVFAPTPAYVRNRGPILWVGDSKSTGFGITNSTQCYAYLTAVAKNRSLYNCSYPSQAMFDYLTAGNEIAIRALTYGAFCNVPPDYVIIEQGYNDALNNWNAAAFQTGYTNFLNTVLAGTPSTTKILCLGILNTNNGTVGPLRSAVNTAISNAVTAVANARASYLNTDSWTNSLTGVTGYTQITTATPSATGGNLANGTYWYAISGTNANGETPVGTAVSATVTGGSGNGSVVLNWTAPGAQTGYKVYRGTTSGNVQLLATVGNVTTYTDSTATVPSGAPLALNTSGDTADGIHPGFFGYLKLQAALSPYVTTYTAPGYSRGRLMGGSHA